MRRLDLNLVCSATFVAGTLDLLSAFGFAHFSGQRPGQILRYVANGALGNQALPEGLLASVTGGAVHFAIMFAMVSTYVLFATRCRMLRDRWIMSGALYGVALYVVMYWVVIPLRFAHLPRADLNALGIALFSHVFCVGLPIAMLSARSLSQQQIRPARARFDQSEAVHAEI